MKRWFIARLGDYEGDGSRVPKTNLYQRNGQPLTSADQFAVTARGWSKAGFAWMFGKLACSDISLMQSDPDIYILPEGAMGLSVGSIPAGVRTTMRGKLEDAGFSFVGVRTTWEIRQLLNYLAAQLQNNINVEAIDVVDYEGSA